MMMSALDTREKKFRWLFRPLDMALTVGTLSLMLTFSLATSGLDLIYALIVQTACTAAMVGLVCAAMFRMGRAAGKV
jgi:hypothetical protein